MGSLVAQDMSVDSQPTHALCPRLCHQVTGTRTLSLAEKQASCYLPTLPWNACPSATATAYASTRRSWKSSHPYVQPVHPVAVSWPLTSAALVYADVCLLMPSTVHGGAVVRVTAPQPGQSCVRWLDHSRGFRMPDTPPPSLPNTHTRALLAITATSVRLGTSEWIV